MRLDGVLFFPVTPFGADGALDEAVLAEHLRAGLAHGPGGRGAASPGLTSDEGVRREGGAFMAPRRRAGGTS